MATLSKDEMVRIMVKSSCRFLEWYLESQLKYFRFYGYEGPNPVRFHPGTGDKLILRRIAHDYLSDIPQEGYWIEHNAKIFGMRMLFDVWYPEYGTDPTVNSRDCLE